MIPTTLPVGCPWRGRGGLGSSLPSQGNGPDRLKGLLATVHDVAIAAPGGGFESHGFHGLTQYSFNTPARLVAYITCSACEPQGPRQDLRASLR